MRTEILYAASVVIATLVFGACASLTGIPNRDSPDGRVYVSRCQSCHGLPDPRLRTVADWNRVLPDMERRIHERGLVPITAFEREAIMRYLNQYARSE